MINTKKGGRNTICKNLKIVYRVPISTKIWPYEWKINFKLQAMICTSLKVNINRISEEILVKCFEFFALQSVPAQRLEVISRFRWINQICKVHFHFLHDGPHIALAGAKFEVETTLQVVGGSADIGYTVKRSSPSHMKLSQPKFD